VRTVLSPLLTINLQIISLRFYARMLLLLLLLLLLLGIDVLIIMILLKYMIKIRRSGAI